MSNKNFPTSARFSNNEFSFANVKKMYSPAIYLSEYNNISKSSLMFVLQIQNNYLLVARIYKGELSTLPGIYFPACFRDFFDQKSRENTRESKFPVKYSSPEGNSRYK